MVTLWKKGLVVVLAILGILAGCAKDDTVDIPTITLTAPGWSESRKVFGVDSRYDNGYLKDADPGEGSFVVTNLMGVDEDPEAGRNRHMNQFVHLYGEEAVSVDDRTILGVPAYGFVHKSDLNEQEVRTWYLTRGRYTYSVTISTWYRTPDMPPEVLDAVNHLAWDQVTVDRERAQRAGLLPKDD